MSTFKIGRLPTQVVNTGESFNKTMSYTNTFKQDIWNEAIKNGREFSLCFIGNSFTRRMTDQICRILRGFGVMNARITSIYRGSCPLQEHAEGFATIELDCSQTQNCTYVMENGEVTRLVHTKDGKYAVLTEKTRKEFFEHFGTDYDFICIMGSSEDSENYYRLQPYINQIISYIKPYAKSDVQFCGFLPWSYPTKASGHTGSTVFETAEEQETAAVNHLELALKAYGLECYEKVLLSNMSIAIQNLRRSYYKDKFNEDVLHLNNVGDALAGLTLLCTLFELNPYDCDLSELFRINVMPYNCANETMTINGYTLKNRLERVAQGAVYDALIRKYTMTESYYEDENSYNCVKLPEYKFKYYMNNHDQYPITKGVWSNSVTSSNTYVLFENDILLNHESLLNKKVNVPDGWVLELVEWNPEIIDKSNSSQWYIKVKKKTLSNGSTITFTDGYTKCCLQAYKTGKVAITDSEAKAFWKTITGLRITDN